MDLHQFIYLMRTMPACCPDKLSDRTEITARHDAEHREDFLNQTAAVKLRWAF